jgi:hypothetical protein
VDLINSSSHLHQIFSFGNERFGRYNTASAREAVRQWALSLKPGGHIIIRDFVAPQAGNEWLINLKTAAARQYFRLFVRGMRGYAVDGQTFDGGFQGRQLQYTMYTEDRVSMPPADAMEFMISMRWGMENLAEHERVVQEEFTHFTTEGYRDLLGQVELDGYRIEVVEAHRYATEFYTEFWHRHLKVYEFASDGLKLMREFPAFKQVMVAQKVELPDGSVGAFIIAPQGPVQSGGKALVKTNR